MTTSPLRTTNDDDLGVVLRRVPRISADKVARHRTRRRTLEYGLAVAVPTVLILLWQVASVSGWIDRKIFPPPTEVFTASVDLWSSGRLPEATWDSLAVIGAGFGLGALAGFAVGVVTGLSRLARSALEPFLMALYVVPKLALLPVFLTIFGFGAAPKIALVVVTVFFFVWIDVMEALWRVPEGYVEAGRALHMGGRELFWHVRLPAILPNLFVSLRISIGVAVLVTIAAEFIVGSEGLGYLIFSSNQYFLLERVYAGIVTVAVVGVLLAWVITLLGKWATPWGRVGKR